MVKTKNCSNSLRQESNAEQRQTCHFHKYKIFQTMTQFYCKTLLLAAKEYLLKLDCVMFDLIIDVEIKLFLSDMLFCRLYFIQHKKVTTQV